MGLENDKNRPVIAALMISGCVNAREDHYQRGQSSRMQTFYRVEGFRHWGFDFFVSVVESRQQYSLILTADYASTW